MKNLKRSLLIMGIVLIAMTMSIIDSTKVSAETKTELKSYIKCIYDMPDNPNFEIQLDYAAATDKIVIKANNKKNINTGGNISSGSVGANNVNITTSNITNSSNKLYCPVLYYTRDKASGTSALYLVTTNEQTKKHKKLSLIEGKSEINNIDGESFQIESCGYRVGEYEVKFNGNFIDKKLNYTIAPTNGKFVGSHTVDRNDFTFDDVFISGKCNSTLKIWVTCKDKNPLAKICKITKDKINEQSKSSDMQLDPGNSTAKPDDSNYNPNISIDNVQGCGFLKGLDDIFKQIFDTIKLVLIGALIALTILDFIKALTSGTDDDIKKSWKNFMIRVGIVVAIYLLPMIIKIVLKIFLGAEWDACLDIF